MCGSGFRLRPHAVLPGAASRPPLATLWGSPPAAGTCPLGMASWMHLLFLPGDISNQPQGPWDAPSGVWPLPRFPPPSLHVGSASHSLLVASLIPKREGAHTIPARAAQLGLMTCWTWFGPSAGSCGSRRWRRTWRSLVTGHSQHLRRIPGQLDAAFPNNDYRLCDASSPAHLLAADSVASSGRLALDSESPPVSTSSHRCQASESGPVGKMGCW